MEEFQYLAELLKNELMITWDDDETTIRINRIIRNAVSSLDNKLGVKINYAECSQEQELLIAYCVYLYNNTGNEFDINYQNDIMQLRAKYEVQQYELSKGDENEEEDKNI